jgi:hypothetical protein
MGTSSVSFIKRFAIGLTMAVLVDATLIRADPTVEDVRPLERVG